jgi:hypothetical protein
MRALVVPVSSADYTPVICSFEDRTDLGRQNDELKIQGKRRHGTSYSPSLVVPTHMRVLYYNCLKKAKSPREFLTL